MEEISEKWLVWFWHDWELTKNGWVEKWKSLIHDARVKYIKMKLHDDEWYGIWSLYIKLLSMAKSPLLLEYVKSSFFLLLLSKEETYICYFEIKMVSLVVILIFSEWNLLLVKTKEETCIINSGKNTKELYKNREQKMDKKKEKRKRQLLLTPFFNLKKKNILTIVRRSKKWAV